MGKLYFANILLRREDAPLAVQAAEEAILCARDFPGLDAYARAMLASVYLRQSKAPRALLAARDAMDGLTRLQSALEEGGVIRVVEAEALYANDHKAEAMARIKAARDRLLKIAEEINDLRWRQSFLENVPENARTLRFASKWALSEAEDDTAIRVSRPSPSRGSATKFVVLNCSWISLYESTARRYPDGVILKTFIPAASKKYQKS